MDIRPAGPEDLGEASRLSAEVFLQAVAPLYSDEGTRVFLDYASADQWRERHERGQPTWLALEQGRLVGVLHLRDGNHISLFFVAAAYQRNGVGRRLLLHVRKTLGVRVLTVHASPNAVPGYERLGFVPSGPEAVQSGLRFTPMRAVFDFA